MVGCFVFYVSYFLFFLFYILYFAILFWCAAAVAATDALSLMKLSSVFPIFALVVLACGDSIFSVCRAIPHYYRICAVQYMAISTFIPDNYQPSILIICLYCLNCLLLEYYVIKQNICNKIESLLVFDYWYGLLSFLSDKFQISATCFLLLLLLAWCSIDIALVRLLFCSVRYQQWR